MAFSGVYCPVCSQDMNDSNTRTCELSRLMREQQGATFRAEPFRATPEKPICLECGVSDGGFHHAHCGIIGPICTDCGGSNPDCKHDTDVECKYGCNGLVAVNTGFSEGQWRTLLEQFVELSELSKQPAILRTISGYCLEWDYVYHEGKYIHQLDPKKQFKLLPGCFDHSLANSKDIPLTLDGDKEKTLARTSDGTLRIVSDDCGLLVPADLVDTPLDRELCETIDAGNVRGWSHKMSLLFSLSKTTRKGDVTLRTFESCPLGAINLVVNNFPRARTRTTPVFLSGGPRQKVDGTCAVKIQS